MLTRQEVQRRYRERHPERVKAGRDRYNAKTAEYRKQWARDNPASRKATKYRHLYGALPPRPAPAACECCGSPPGKKALCFDHDHVTGAFRGWLCDDCNVALGRVGDTIDGVRRLLAYMEAVELAK